MESRRFRIEIVDDEKFWNLAGTRINEKSKSGALPLKWRGRERETCLDRVNKWGSTEIRNAEFDESKEADGGR